MNSAYRYWNRVSWYPTHYVCLDDQLIETHADAIYDLITSEKVKTALLIAKILDYHPNLLIYKNVFFLESFHTIRQKRVADKGIPYIRSVYFKESNASKVTTGAYSVRFAAHLGYSLITILGVDLRYTEIIPEAKSQGGIKLMVMNTPRSNPNYFFDDYQRSGDKYNIPNPDFHGRSLHISAFESLSNDIVQFEWSVRVYNSTQKSMLYEKAILPYIDIKSFTSRRSLSAVVVPVTPKEVDQIARNLECWDKPLLAPSLYPNSDHKPDLVFAFSCASNPELTIQVLNLFQETIYAKGCFAKCEVIFVNLDRSLDYYEKDYSKNITGRGYKSGPNEQFFELISRLSHYSGFIFYMETDCIPLRQGWLDEVRTLTENDSESWVIGSYYRGKGRISNRFALHLNGNALYRVGDVEFISFVEDFWRPQLYKLLEIADNRMAYDCFLSYYFTTADPSSQNREWKILQQICHRFRGTSLVQNISGAVDNQENPADIIRRVLAHSPTTFLVHSAGLQKLLNEKLEELRNTEEPPFYWGEIIGQGSIGNDYSEYDWQILPIERSVRLLLIDSTPVGHPSATGQIKKTFLGGWPESNFLQIWETGGQTSSLRLMLLGESIEHSRQTALSLDAVVERCRQFDPEVIYFRPVDSDVLFEVAERIVSALNKPLVIHMMDDWPERLRLTDIAKFDRCDNTLRRLLNMAVLRLSIGKAMSDAYEGRYGGEWLSLANGVNVEETPCKDWRVRPSVTNADPFLIRYMGALADDMTYTSIRDIADAVAFLQAKHPIRFEVFTMDWCRAKAEKDMDKLPGVSILPLVNEKLYQKTLCEADCLVIAYNFDSTSIAYIGPSLANKMPECLASGVPLLVYGPLEVATISYLRQAGCAQVVSHRDQSKLRNAILELLTDRVLCQQLGSQGRDHVSAYLSKHSVQAKFLQYLSEASSKAFGTSNVVVGQFTREQRAHYDETECIAELYKMVLTGKVMIDVGAHHGSAHAPFLDRGWQIFAFEPDEKNRAKLLERLSMHKNNHLVSLDPRCVGNKSQSGVSFFVSEQSTGISGLSAFHKSHHESHKVDIITLKEFFRDGPMPAIDFLKIDTEGHDKFVLEGYPWERSKPAVIECEFEDTKTMPLGYAFQDLAEFLVNKGYIVYVSEWHPIIRYGIRHDWRRLLRYPCELADRNAWGNLLAFRKPIDETALVAAVNKVLKTGTPPPANPLKSAAVPAMPVPIGKPTFYFESGPMYTYLAPNQWRYTHVEARQQLWMAIAYQQIYSGQTVAGGLRIQADRFLTVTVTLGRHGSTEWEGNTERIQISPGQSQAVKLTKPFRLSHAALRLQVEVVDLPNGGCATLSISELHLGETVGSIIGRLDATKIRFSEANRLFRLQDYSTALAMYFLLYQQRPMSFYADNALHAARRSGLGEFANIDVLRQDVGL